MYLDPTNIWAHMHAGLGIIGLKYDCRTCQAFACNQLGSFSPPLLSLCPSTSANFISSPLTSWFYSQFLSFSFVSAESYLHSQIQQKQSTITATRFICANWGLKQTAYKKEGRYTCKNCFLVIISSPLNSYIVYK